MTTVGELASAVTRWWERDDAPELFDALTAAIESDQWGPHALCTLVACRSPLHPGPCKGWKHTLHLVSPGAWKSLEQARVDKLNHKRLARVAALKAQGKPVPAALLRPITPRLHPGAPPPGWTPGHLAPHQPAAQAGPNVDRIVSQVGQKARNAAGPAHAAAHAGTAPHIPGQVSHGVAVKPAAPAPATYGANYNAAQRIAANLSRYRGEVTTGQLTALEGLTDADYKGLDDSHKIDLHGRLRSERGPNRARAQALADKFDALDGRTKGPLVPAPATPAAPAAAPATPATQMPAQRASSLAAQHAAKLAAGGTGKAKLAAYEKLTKADFDGLPDDTKTKIARDLTLLHGKFLDPKKRAAVAAVQGKLNTDAHLKSVGTPAAAPAATPSVPATKPGVVAVAPTPPSATAARRRLDKLAGLDKATFDGKTPAERAATLHALDGLSKPGSGLDDADRQRAADLHTKLRGAPAPAAPAGGYTMATANRVRKALDPQGGNLSREHAIAELHTAGQLAGLTDADKSAVADYLRDRWKAEPAPDRRGKISVMLADLTGEKRLGGHYTKDQEAIATAARNGQVDRLLGGLSGQKADAWKGLEPDDKQHVRDALDRIAAGHGVGATAKDAETARSARRSIDALDAQPSPVQPGPAPAAPSAAKTAADAVAAKGYPPKAADVARAAHTGSDLDFVNALAELTPEEHDRLDAVDGKKVTERLDAALKSKDQQVADLAKELHESVASTHAGSSKIAYIDQAAGRVKARDALSRTGSAQFLQKARELTPREVGGLTPAHRRELEDRLRHIAGDRAEDTDIRLHAAQLHHALDAPVTDTTDARSTLGRIADAHSERFTARVDRALTKHAQYGAAGTLKTDLDNALFHAAQAGHSETVRQHMLKLAADTNRPSEARAALAYRAIAHDSAVPASVRLALDYAHNAPNSLPGSALASFVGANTTSKAVPPVVRDIIDTYMSRLVAAQVEKIHGYTMLDTLNQEWDQFGLAKRLDDDAKKAIRDAATREVDTVVHPTPGRKIGVDEMARAITAQDLLDRVNGQAPSRGGGGSLKVRQLLNTVAANAAGGSSSGIDPLPAARSLTPQEYRSLPPLQRAVLNHSLARFQEAQETFPASRGVMGPNRETTAAYELARLTGKLPTGHPGWVNRSLATATVDLKSHTPGEALHDLTYIDRKDYDKLGPSDQKSIRDALTAIAGGGSGSWTPSTDESYIAQEQLDDLTGQTYPPNLQDLIDSAHPNNAKVPGITGTAAAAGTGVSKADFDSLPKSYRDVIKTRLQAAAASGDQQAATALARFDPAVTPLGVGSPGHGVTGLPAAPTVSSDPKIQAALDTIYGAHPKAATTTHQIATYGALTAHQFGQLNGPEQQQVLGDLAYIAATSKGANATKARGFISRFSAPGTPAGQVGAQPVYPPAGSVVGQTRLPVPQAGLLVGSKNPGQGGDGFITLSNGKRVWGKYGAAGLLLAHDGPDGKRRYLMVQRGSGISDPGKWHYPGGAIDSNESAYEGGTREVLEELGFDPKDLAAAKVHGYHEAAQPGWKYTSIVATVDHQLTPHLKSASHGGETADAKWLTMDEIRDLDKRGQLLAPLAGGAFEQNVASVLPPAGPRTVAQVAAPTRRLKRLAAPKPTAHKVVKGRNLIADKAAKDKLRQDVKAARATYSGKTADDRLAAIAHMQGYDDLPTVAKKAEIDRLLATGDYIEAWRGVKGTWGGKSAKEINDDMRYGNAYFGRGIFGNGYYLATQRSVATQYSDGSAHSVIRILIPKSAVTEVHTKVMSDANQAGTSRSKAKGGGHEDSTLWDEGRYAAAVGLDGIEIPPGMRSRSYGGSGHVAKVGKPAYNWLNRATLIIQEEAG